MTPFSRSPLTRTPMKRTGKKKRSASEKHRIYGSDERIAWVKRQPCVIADQHACFGGIECAHTENGGMGRKADADTIVPLCVAAHRLLHAVGVKSFERTYGVNLKIEAQWFAAAWREGRE